MQVSNASRGFELIFGANASGNANGTRHLHPGYSDSATHTQPLQRTMARAGILRNMYVHANGAGTGSGSLTYSLTVDGVARLSVTVGATETDGSNTADSYAYAKGAKLGCTVIANGTVSAGGHDAPVVTVEAG